MTKLTLKNNRKMIILEKLKSTKTTFTKAVALPGLTFIILLSLFCGIFPETADSVLTSIKTYISSKLSWVYVFSVSIFVIFLIIVAISNFGKIKLGADDSEPKYSFYSWIAMLFAAGMGIGLMYFGVSETLSHYASDVTGTGDQVASAKNAQLFTFFHWGIHAWSIYAVVGLVLAYFAYRYKLPLAIRSGLYPILKDKIYGPAGNIIDIFGLCSTFFGIATTLGFGVMQLNGGLVTLGIVDSIDFNLQAIIVTVVTAIAVISATSGVDKGVKILSEINLIVAVALMLAVLILGPTIYLLGTFSEGLGYYISNFMNLTFNTYSFEQEHQEWFSNWTILYWAWWISWSPYVGLFIAKISKGRTIREFIVAVLLVPTLFNFLWMTIFGNSAVWIDRFEAPGVLTSFLSNPDVLLFKFFDYFPMSIIFSIISLIIICIFFVTSADSGIYIMNSISSKDVSKIPKWQNIFWGILLIVLSLSLLRSGGLGSLQTMTLISALPFALVMILLCYSLLKALKVDNQFHESKFSHGSLAWDGKHWKKRLKKILSFSNKEEIKSFLNTDVREAFEDLAKELSNNNIEAKIYRRKTPTLAIELVIKHDQIRDFKYGVSAEAQTVSDVMQNENNTPDMDSNTSYLPITYFSDGRMGNDIQYLSKDEIIADILREYDRFINIISDDQNALLYKVSVPDDDEENKD